MKNNIRKLISLLLTATLLLALCGTAFAEDMEADVIMEEVVEEIPVQEQPAAEAQEEQANADKMEVYTTIENTFPSAIPLTIGEKVQVGERQDNEKGQYYNAKMKYSFVVDKPSMVNFALSTEATTSTQRTNVLIFNVLCENTSSLVYATNVGFGGSYNVRVDSTQMPLEKELVYKLLPGTYYVTVDSSINAFGWISLKSITPMKADSSGEPNESTVQAKTIKLGGSYGGNIGYAGKRAGTAEYGGDKSDYYKVNVPFDGCALKLTASRADKERNNNIDVFLTGSTGYGVGGKISLTDNPSGSITYKDLKKGVYYVLIQGMWANSYPTEYSFKIDYPVHVSGVALNKTSASVLKGNTFTLKATVSPTNATYKAVTWKSSNTAVASVNSKGLVTGKAKGVVYISAITKDGAKVAKCRVAVKLPA